MIAAKRGRARVNEAHEDVTDVRAVLSLEEETVVAIIQSFE